MEQRRFGDSDLVTSTIGFGTWEMSTTMYGHIDTGEASDAVNMAIDRGITLFDTAEVYGPGHSEELLAKALGSRRNEVVLVTKVGFDYDDTPQVIGLNSKKDHINRAHRGLPASAGDRLRGPDADPLAPTTTRPLKRRWRASKS